jgi:hypothetical protein
MFVITDADAAAIRAIFDQEGELSAAIDLRRRFPGIGGNSKARAVCPEHRRVDAAAGTAASGDTAPTPQGRLVRLPIAHRLHSW